ncbi:MAG: tetratricopeptide repeat protein [Rhodothermales bacterium]|nr:tetratricopeptide repeat protein [Rhodothermales bacterium]
MDRLAQLLEYLEEDPEDAFTHFALALEYAKRGENESALHTFERLVADHSDYVGAYYHLGALYQRLGRTDSAIETYRAGILVAEKQRDAHAKAELQSVLLEAQGVGFDDD